MLRLSGKWAPFFNSQPETGMGYVIATVRLRDGREFERVCVVEEFVTSVDGKSEIPFADDDIAEFIVTHDKKNLLR